MTKEEKQLLIKDLCARLPYEVKCLVVFDDGIKDIMTLKTGLPNGFGNWDFRNKDYSGCSNDFKPYLRPMESMTEEERKEWFKQSRVEYDCEFHTEPTLSLCNCHLSTDWLNKKMFDYRGLIHMGLALPAKEGMYDKMEGTRFRVGDVIHRKQPGEYDRDMKVVRIEADYYLCDVIGKFCSEMIYFSEERDYELATINKMEE